MLGKDARESSIKMISGAGVLGRQQDVEGAPRHRFGIMTGALDPDCAAMQFDNTFDDTQAQACTSTLESDFPC